MVIKIVNCFVITGFLSVCLWAQGTAALKWTRIEGHGEVSVAVPRGFLVDGEKSLTGKTHRIFAGAGSTSIELIFRDTDKFKGKMTRPANPQEGVEYFTAEGMDGSRMCSAPDRRVSCTISLLSGSHSYDFTVESSSEKPELAQAFLASIMVRGKPVLVGVAPIAVETVQLSDLTTSAEVKTAMERKQTGPVRVTRARLAEFIAGQDGPVDIIPVLILDKPSPGNLEKISLSQPPNFGKKREVNDIVVRGAWANVTFLANGQIGDVVIYSDEKKDYIEDYIRAIKEIKFVPARNNGKSVDSVQFLNYTMNFL